MRMAIVTAALVLGACAPRPSGPSRLEAESEIAIRTLIGMVEAGNADDVAGLFRPDAVYDDFANQHQYRGLEEIAGYVSGGSRWATGVSMNVIDVHVSSTAAVAEWVFTGIQDHPVGALLPVVTGREVVLNGVTIIEMEDGRIRRAADYVDALPLVLQLGGEVHMPGGGVLKQDPADPPLPSDTLPTSQEP